MFVFTSAAITIGFERIEYNVSEGDRVEVCAVLMSGILEKDVLVFVNSSDGTANGTHNKQRAKLIQLDDVSHATQVLFFF